MAHPSGRRWSSQASCVLQHTPSPLPVTSGQSHREEDGGPRPVPRTLDLFCWVSYRDTHWLLETNKKRCHEPEGQSPSSLRVRLWWALGQGYYRHLSAAPGSPPSPMGTCLRLNSPNKSQFCHSAASMATWLLQQSPQ